MVDKIIVILSLLTASILFSPLAAADNKSSQKISANHIKQGCALVFDKNVISDDTHALGVPPHNLVVIWVCQGQKSVKIDQYEVEGESPQIATVILWQNKGFVVLVKWSINSQASDFSGTFYKVYIYEHNLVSGAPAFIRQDKLMSKFGQGWDGNRDGVIVAFPFKDAASIRKKLRQLNEW
jgi:hypothetical protein